LQSQIHELIGKTLACHCHPPNACHGHFLAEMAEKRRIELAGKSYPPKRFIVCGPRKWPNSMSFWVYLIIHGLKKRYGDDIVIITGKAPGIDTIALEAAEYFDLDTEEYPADWRKGAMAGNVRNQQMLDEGKPDWVMAIGMGRGTSDMTNRAKNAGIMVTWRAWYIGRFSTPAQADDHTAINRIIEKYAKAA